MRLAGWYRAFRDYLRTPKGAFDFKDYLRAMLLIILTCALLILLLYIGGGL